MDNYNKLQQNILEKIKSGEIKMKAKPVFVAHLILLIMFSLLILLTSSFVISFIFFSIHESGKFFLLGFGFRGFEVFFVTFPWWLLLLDLLFIIVLEWLLKRFSFGYRNPLIYTVSAIILITLAAGFILDETPLHDLLLHEEQHKNIPVIGGFYDGIRRPPHEFGVFRGAVVSVEENTFIMVNNDSDAGMPTVQGASSTAILQVILDPSVPASSLVFPGDTVFVAGDLTGNIIHAYGIRKLLPSDEEN